MGESNRILVVDDDEAIRRGLSRLIDELGHEAETAADVGEALSKAAQFAPDLVITDLSLPDLSGLDLISSLLDAGSDATFVVLTAHGSIDSAVEATRRGVYDFLEKPVDAERLAGVIHRGLERSAMRKEVQRLRREMARSGRYQKLLGRSPAMLNIYRMIEQVGPSFASVLITGESGTGKDIVARTIHETSPRARGPFVAVNCAAIPESLLESEILGHEKGSFTNATSTRAGVFELAHQGTLFLDEIAEMPTSLQSKLLRVLEDKRVRRIGGSREIPVDVRVLAATNADVPERLASGAMRDDLYFRLNVFTLHLPPLRERIEDLPLLAESFLEEYARENEKAVFGFADEALDLMSHYYWPGNIRELRNAIQRAVIVCRTDEITARDLPPAVRPTVGPDPQHEGFVLVSIGTSIDEVEKVVLLETLAACGNNKTRAAGLLGISAKTLHAKLKRYRREGGTEGAPTPPPPVRVRPPVNGWKHPRKRVPG